MSFHNITLTLSDFFDIVLTAYAVYLVLLLIRGTRAVQILQGVAVLVLLRIVAQFFHLWTVFSILNGLLIVSGVAIPVVFQPELRRALAQLGRAGFFEPGSPHHDPETVEEICAVLGRAALVLSRSAIGAIIVIERSTGLEEYLESGTSIDAVVTPEMLLAIFSPRSPIHDGAVVIRRGRIAAAACFLPLSENTLFERRLGTRHRAALGITEQTDAIALVVSEESGAIGIARDGQMTESIEAEETAVAAVLKQIFLRPSPPADRSLVRQLKALWSRMHFAHDATSKTELRS